MKTEIDHCFTSLVDLTDSGGRKRIAPFDISRPWRFGLKFRVFTVMAIVYCAPNFVASCINYET